MTPSDKPGDATLISCEVCLKEIPKSEASVAEAVDYFVYFCGADCYQKWNRTNHGWTRSRESRS